MTVTTIPTAGIADDAVTAAKASGLGANHSVYTKIISWFDTSR